ncbi:MAG: type II CRISPR RNA-guided endonuclease Cas9 [Bacteroidetes bacterium]|nr:type II CRISPR RNA-guided endonuclease Cas9 [Bacteroidota bacterium]
MTKILGLDLGTNSIGWAVVDGKNNKINGIGARIFPMGVNMIKGTVEESKNATRREARGKRKNYFRRKIRKNLLLKELQKNNMAPNAEVEINEWNKENPYPLRQRAISKPVSLLELGRIFFHLSQRRGFKSNRKAGGEEDKEKSTIFKGVPASGKIGISETKQKIENYKTLGDYLASINPHETRIRNRYTTRKMYIDEFNFIWEEQKKYHAKILTDTLKAKLGINDKGKETGILFYQRPLRSQKHLIGKCTFEPTKTKCSVSAIPFELFRAWQWTHSVECDGEKLTKEQREIILNLLCSKDKTEFKDIRKILKLGDSSYNFNYKDDDKVVGTYTISKLSKLFGKNWDEMNEQQKEDVWHTIYTATDDEWLLEYAARKWNLDEKQIKSLKAINLKQDYAQLSRKAILNILEFLPDFRYDEAVVLAGVKNAFGNDWNNFDSNKKDEIINAVADIVLNNENYIEIVKDYLKDDYSLTEEQLKKLYHHSLKMKSELKSKLPVDVAADKEISNLRNPMVSQALFELRSLVNNLIDEHGAFDEIKVEMARDLKSSSDKRMEIRKDQKRLEVKNDEVKKELEKYNLPPTHDNVLKYKLWQECKEHCPYTGKQIAIEILFSGEIQIEHIVPWSISLNDSYMNKTLCFADENRAKGDKTPFQYYGNDDAKWKVVKERAKKIFANPNSYSKYKTFIKQTVDTDFISRQLNDTRYIAKEAKVYLEKVCKNVKVAPGQMTANLRHHWGLNKILNTVEDTKNRDDHRHHAIDALVMACFTQKHLNEISKWNRYNRTYEMAAISRPWENFWNDTKAAIDTILVSHKNKNRVLTSKNVILEKNGKVYKNKGVAARGQLHLETIYGKHKDKQGKEFLHLRKPLEALDNKAKVNKIADINVQKLIIAAIEKAGGYTGEKKDKVPPNAFFKTDEHGNKIPFVFLPNKNGSPIPIKKVRLKEPSENAVMLKDINQWVDPGSNHHIIIYEDALGVLKQKVVSFWDVVERKNRKDNMFKLPDDGAKIITTLSINDMFIVGLKDEDIDWKSNARVISKYLYRVQKTSTTGYNVVFRHHLASNIDNPKQMIGIASMTAYKQLNPVKIKISPSGKIKKIN